MSRISHMAPAVQAALIRRAEVDVIAFVTRVPSYDVLSVREGLELRFVARNAEHFGSDAAVSIARHAASAVRARTSELDDLLTMRLWVSA